MPIFRRSGALFSALSLSVLLAACGDSESYQAEMSPLKAVCEGTGAPNAAEYDRQANTSPIAVAIVSEGGTTSVDSRYIKQSSGTSAMKRAKKASEVQIVACVSLKEPGTIDICRYAGAPGYQIIRQKQEAEVKLVSAKTAQVLGTQTFSAEGSECPRSISYRENSSPPSGTKTYGAGPELRTAIAQGMPRLVAQATSPNSAAVTSAPSNASSSNVASSNVASSSNVDFVIPENIEKPTGAEQAQVKAHCETLEAARKTKGYLHITLRMSMDLYSLDMSGSDFALKLDVQGLKKELDENLPILTQAIATTESVTPNQSVLADLQKRYLQQLQETQASFKALEPLVKEADTLIQAEPVDRAKLQPISDQVTQALLKINKDVGGLETLGDRMFQLCLKLT